jgi:hypothetical protein
MLSPEKPAPETPETAIAALMDKHATVNVVVKRAIPQLNAPGSLEMLANGLTSVAVSPEVNEGLRKLSPSNRGEFVEFLIALQIASMRTGNCCNCSKNAGQDKEGRYRLCCRTCEGTMMAPCASQYCNNKSFPHVSTCLTCAAKKLGWIVY